MRRPTYNPQMTEGKAYSHRRHANSTEGIAPGMSKSHVTVSDGKRYPFSIIRVKGHAQCKIVHPTQKPIYLMDYLIRTYSNEGDLVLDNCMGSGTTGVSAIMNNRRFIGIEKEDKYFNIAVNRISDIPRKLW